jgi:hypothetical protein
MGRGLGATALIVGDYWDVSVILYHCGGQNCFGDATVEVGFELSS